MLSMSCEQENQSSNEWIDREKWRKVVSELFDAAARGEIDPLMQKARSKPTKNCMDNHALTNKGM